MKNKKSIGLPSGPNEFLKDITQHISVEGYKRYSKDVNNPYNIIESSNITMEDVDFPVRGYGNNGVVQDMIPGENYNYGNADYVVEMPMLQTGGGVNKEGVNQYKWFKNYIQSPKYTERLKKEFPDYSNNQIEQEAKARLNNLMQTSVGFLPNSSKYSKNPGDTQGFYGSEDFPNTMMLRPEYSASTSDEIFEPGNYLSPYKTIPLHEWSHVADNVGKRIPQSTTDFMLSKMKENILERPKDQYYYTKPTEYLGRMQPLRYLMQQEGLYDPGTQDFTKEYLEKAKQNKTIKNNQHFQDLMDNVNSDKDFIELMNNVASTNNLNSQTFNMPTAQDGTETKIYNKPIEQEEGIVASIDNFVTPILRKFTGRAGTNDDISLRVPPGEMKFFRNNEQPVNSNYIIGGDYMEDEPTAYKASEYPNTMYTTKGQTQEIDFETQQFYGVVDGNIKLGKKIDFKDDDVIVPLRPNFGGNFTLQEKKPLSPEFIKEAKEFNKVTNQIRESAYLFPEQKVWEEMVTVKKKGSRKTGPGVYEFNPEYKDIINKLKDKFGKGSYMYDLEPILKNYNSNGYDILNTAGNQLDTFGNKVILFDPESNEHLFISQLGEQKRNEKIIAFKEKYPNANYLNLDNGRFSNYMVNKEGINSDNAEEYMQNSFKGPDATGYNFAYQEGGDVPKAQAGTEQATISQYEEPAWYEKALDRLASPMTAFGYSARNQDVPDNLPINMEERNAHDSIIDTFNPFAWIKYGAQANRDLEEGEYLDAGLNILGALPIVPAWLSKTKKVLPPAVVNKIATYTDDAVKVSEKLKRYSPEGANSFSELMRTPINQLPYFKLNPNKFKPDPNKFYYRGIGRSGIEDAINSGVVRPPTGSTFGDALYMSANVNVADKYASDAASVFNKNFWKSDADPTKYIAEIPITSLTNPNSKEAFKRMNKLGSTFHEYVEPNSIPSSKVNFYKQNWLKGYKKFNFQNGGWLDKFEDGQYTYGGALPQAQFGGLGRYLKPLIKQGVKYADEFFNPQIVDNFKFKNLPTVDKKQFMKVVDGEFDTIDYDHLIPTTQEISDLATKTRSRLMSDKFIKNNMEATGRSKDEVVGYIDDYIKEFENSTLAFDKTRGGAAGLYTRGKITIDPRNPHLTKENVLGTLEHEIEHMFSNVGQQGSDLYRHPKFKLVDRTGMPDESLVQNMGQAFEQQVRFRKALGWLEKNAGLKVGDDVTDKQVETLTDAIANWSKEGGKDFRGTGANFDIQHLFSNLDAEQFLKPGQFLMPNAPRAANLKNSNVRQGIKDILNKTYAVGAVGGLGAASQMGPKQEDGQYAYGGSLSKLYQDGGEQPKTWKDIKINKDGLKRAIAEVESINGVLMINPESTATGLYGQRFSELEEGKLYEGTRDEFAKDLEAQNRIFDMRLNEGIKSNKTTPLLKDAFDLTNEYKDQLGDKWNYSYEDLIALSNFLGRGGTREFLGNVIRDGKTLEEVYPTKFGKDAKQANKTPYEYLEKTRGYYQKGGSTTNPYTIYKNYINGVYRGSKMESKAEKIYDKLNRLHYRDAKANQMTPANYVLTHVIG